MSATATKDTPPASQAPSVLEALGLGTPSKPAATDAPDESTKSDAVLVAQSATAVATETKTETPKAEDKADGDKGELTKLQKQLKDTRDAFTQERQVNKTLLAQQKELAQKVDVLMKKVDGTYDEATDGPKVPTADEIRQQAYIRASHKAAIEYYGEEYVMKTIWADDAPFRQFDNDLDVRNRVFASETPILEAIKVVKEAETKAKYGPNPDSMRKALEAELRPIIEKEVRQKLKETRGAMDADEVKGLAHVRTASDTKVAEPKSLDFNNLFGNFRKTAG